MSDAQIRVVLCILSVCVALLGSTVFSLWTAVGNLLSRIEFMEQFNRRIMDAIREVNER